LDQVFLKENMKTGQKNVEKHCAAFLRYFRHFILFYNVQNLLDFYIAPTIQMVFIYFIVKNGLA
jgi:hypothetical protein